MAQSLTVSECAQWASVTPDNVPNWLQFGTLRGHKLSNRSGWRVTERDLAVYLASRLVVSSAAVEGEHEQ